MMMFLSRHFSLALCGLVAVAATADVAFAQRGGGGRGQTSRTRYELATLPEVQAELKLNDAQKKLATDLLAKQREKRASAGGPGGGGNWAAMQAEMAKMNAEFDAELLAKMDDTQKTRMNGLVAQANGAAALMDEAIAKAMQLNDEQVAKLKSASDANRAARREAMSGWQDMSQEDRQAAMTKLTEKENAALLATMSDEQKKKFDALKGAELKMDFTSLRPARRAQ
jgi:hypothetical protein